MKRYTSSLAKSALALSLLVPAVSTAAAPAYAGVQSQANISVIINGQMQSYDQPPLMLNNRVMVPMRSIFEALGAEVTWNPEFEQITVTKGSLTTKLSTGQTFVTGGTLKGYFSFDQAPIILNDRTLVPVRMISELFGANVVWDASTSTVKISTDHFPLFDAIEQQNLDQIRSLLAQGMSTERKTFGYTTLAYALHFGKWESAELLLDLGADLERTVLDDNIMGSELENVKFYLQHMKATPATKQRVAEEALIHAATSNNTGLTNMLLQLQVDPNAKQGAQYLLDQEPYRDDLQITPPLALIFQGQNYNLEAAKQLLEAGADPNNIASINQKPVSPLFDTASHNQSSMTRLLLQHGANPNVQDDKGWTPLMIAAERGYTATLQQLLDNGADPNVTNAGGATALMIAERHGNRDTVKRLEAAGAIRQKNIPTEASLYYDLEFITTATTNQWTPLMKAALRGETDRVRSLLAQGADPNQLVDTSAFNTYGLDDYTTFQLAIRSGNLETIRAFYESKKPLNQAQNVLIEAVHQSNLEMAELALNNGANPDQATVMAPALISLYKNDIEMMQLLLDRGATLFDYPSFVFSPITQQGHLQMVELLISTMKDRNVEGIDEILGQMLKSAVQQQNLPLVRLYLEAGANPNYKYGYFTALEEAELRGLSEFVEVLKQADSAR